MSDNYNDPDDDGDGEDFKNLRAKARKADQYERELAALRRENAFIKAGIPMEDPKMGYFVKGYDGELDPSSIRQAAVEAGFIAPQTAPDPVLDQAREGQQRILQASTGAPPTYDDAGIMFQMDQAYQEGGLAGLSSVTEQYGVTFQPESI